MPERRRHVRRLLLYGGGMNLDVLLTGAEAARHVGVSRQLVRRWVQLGHLAPHTVTDRPLYRLGDVLEAERRTRSSRRSARCPYRRVA